MRVGGVTSDESGCCALAVAACAKTAVARKRPVLALERAVTD
jgi:hypothetical protein